MGKTHALEGEPKVLSIEEIFTLAKPEVQYIPIKELGGGIRARQLTMEEVRQLRKDNTKGKGENAELDNHGFYQDTLVLTVEAPLFTKAAAETLFLQRADMVQALCKALDILNGFTSDPGKAEEEAEAEFRAE